MTLSIAQLADLPEIKAAVDWWASQLEAPVKQDSGDANLNLGIALVSSMGRESFPSRRSIARFKECLLVAIAVHCQQYWNPSQPDLGSACRTVSVDYGPDMILHIALAAAGVEIGTLTLPIKTTMWISPGEVKVAAGYHGKSVTIFPKEDK